VEELVEVTKSHASWACRAELDCRRRLEQRLAQCKRSQRYASSRPHSVNVVVHVKKRPLAPLSIKHFRERVAMTAETVERKSPLAAEQSGRARRREIDAHVVGTITAA